MASEKRLIDANALLEKFQYRLPVSDHITECIDECVKMARQIIEDTPTVDAVEVEDPELLEAIKLLIKQYAHSKASDYVHSPVAHALYHTWKQVDERRSDA